MSFSEKKARISAALEQRFFKYIPKKAANWPEEQHRLDRLSRSLAAYTIVALTDVGDEVGANALMDGGNDNGIDAIYYDKISLKLIIVQSKFKGKDQGEAPNQADVLKTISGTKKVLAKDIGNFNKAFQDKFDEIEMAIDTIGVSIHVVIACLGDELGPHALEDLEKAKLEISGLTWELFSCSAICRALDDEQNIESVSVELSLENCQTILQPRKAIYGQVKAKALAALVQAHGKNLFQKNIRQYLGSVAVNTSIEKTVRSNPADFFYLNNGVTALATAITPAPTGKKFRFDGFSIVNGAQTAGSIAGHNNISDDALVMITVIQADPNNDDMGLRITKARNYQNAVRGIDFAGLDAEQERIRKELASIGIIYHYRPSAEARIRNSDSITIEEAALALACMTFPLYSSTEIAGHQPKRDNGIDYVVAAKKEIGRIWEVEGSFYKKLFTGNLSGIRLARFVNIFRFLDEILSASERSSSDYASKMFYRHGRYFIIAAIAHHFPDIFQKTDPRLSENAPDGTEGDKAKLSRMLDEISAATLVLSVRIGGPGYLSVFRNTGTTQELANALLAYLPAKNLLPSQANANIAALSAAPLPVGP